MRDPNIIMKPMNNHRRAPAGTHAVQSSPVRPDSRRQNRAGTRFSPQVRRNSPVLPRQPSPYVSPLTCPLETALILPTKHVND